MDTQELPYVFVDGKYITYHAIKWCDLSEFSAHMQLDTHNRLHMFSDQINYLQLKSLLTIPLKNTESIG